MLHESLPTEPGAKPIYGPGVVEASRLVDDRIVETEMHGNVVEAQIEGDEVQGVKANLRDLYNLMPGVDEDTRVDEYTREFGKMLASRLDSTLTPGEFVTICKAVLYDLRVGVNGITHQPIRNVLVGKELRVFTELQAKIPHIAQLIFSEEFAVGVQRELEFWDTYN